MFDRPYGLNKSIWLENTHMDRSVKRYRLAGAQIRAARALLHWSAADLAREAMIGINTIRRAEIVDYETSLTTANEAAIRRTLESAGVEFIEANGGGPGVRLRTPQNGKT